SARSPDRPDRGSGPGTAPTAAPEPSRPRTTPDPAANGGTPARNSRASLSASRPHSRPFTPPVASTLARVHALDLCLGRLCIQQSPIRARAPADVLVLGVEVDCPSPGLLHSELVDGDGGVDDAVLQERHHADLEHRRAITALLRLQPAQDAAHLSLTVDTYLPGSTTLQRLLLSGEFLIARLRPCFDLRAPFTPDPFAVLLQRKVFLIRLS